MIILDFIVGGKSWTEEGRMAALLGTSDLLVKEELKRRVMQSEMCLKLPSFKMSTQREGYALAE